MVRLIPRPVKCQSKRSPPLRSAGTSSRLDTLGTYQMALQTLAAPADLTERTITPPLSLSHWPGRKASIETFDVAVRDSRSTSATLRRKHSNHGEERYAHLSKLSENALSGVQSLTFLLQRRAASSSCACSPWRRRATSTHSPAPGHHYR